MFFDRERTRIKLQSEDCHVGNVECQELANGEAQKQRYELFIRGANQHGVKVPGERNHKAQTPGRPTVGYLKKKNWLTPGRRAAQMSPRSHARTVDAGIVGSSVFDTADRTSGYGDSSSSVPAVMSKLGSSSWSVVSPYYIYQLDAVRAAQEREMTNRNIKKVLGLGLLEVMRPLVLIRERHVN
jgi:hypothetical protein